LKIPSAVSKDFPAERNACRDAFFVPNGPLNGRRDEGNTGHALDISKRGCATYDGQSSGFLDYAFTILTLACNLPQYNSLPSRTR